MTLRSFLNLPGLSARESAEPGFALALSAVAERLGLDPDYIGAVMSLESGYRPDAVNPKGGATGLIQFMPATATGLGTSTAALRRMTAIEQLPFVEAFFKVAGRGIRKDVPGDYYMATFHPDFVGRPGDSVIATKGEITYDQNAGLDKNHDGILTVSDVWAAIDQRVANAQALPPLVVDTEKKRSPVAVQLPGLWFWCWGRLLSLRTSGRVGGSTAELRGEL